MQNNHNIGASILGAFLFTGLSAVGYLLGDAAIEYKQFERTVTVKGLAEREYNADVAIWPIQFTAADNNLERLYNAIEQSSSKIKQFLTTKGIKPEEITFSSPGITDRYAQHFYNNEKPEYRYTAIQTVTVYSKDIQQVRMLSNSLPELGKQGIVFTGGNYQTQTEYIFTRLNEVKPKMVEEATNNAREIAEKFASDSQSKLGKIKRASQGQFSITARDSNNPHIKKVRVVSTIEYYLSD